MNATTRQMLATMDPVTMANEDNRTFIPLRLTRLESEPAVGRVEYGVAFITAGYVRRRDGEQGNWKILPSALEPAVSLFNGLGCFIDHASLATLFYPQIKNEAGTTFGAWWNGETRSIDGAIRLSNRPDQEWFRFFLQEHMEDQEAAREVSDVGLSAVLPGIESEWVGDDDEAPRERHTVGITKAESVDFVFGPGTESRVKEVLSQLQRFILPVQQQISNGGIATMTEELQQEEVQTPQAQAPPEPAPPAQALPEPDPPAPVPSGNSNLALTLLQDQVSQLTNSMQQLVSALGDGEERRVIGEMNMGVAPHDNPRLHGMLNSLDRIEVALDALIGGSAPPSGVPSLTGIRELYHILSGDYEMHGRYQSERVMLASVNSSTMAGLVANALNKRVMNLFAQYPRWWEPGVSREDFASLQDVRWMTLGGVGELPTVAAGAAYTELTWDDQTETDSFVKKGGYLGVTLETIDKDDTRQITMIPSVLAQGAWLTLSKDISAIFTDNSDTGPAMSDSNNLFDASNHSNLGTTALSWSGWDTARIAMMKQTELNSGERLGALTRPYLLWVPVDLESTALEVLGSDGKPGTANNDVNVNAEGDAREARLGVARNRIICNPLWTDADNWAAQANPLLYPSIGLGYRYGDTPEIFSVASPTAGLMFSNDTMPIKVRYFYAVGPIDWRGLYKMNVA